MADSSSENRPNSEAPKPKRKVSRRTILRATLSIGAVTVATAVLGFVRTRGYSLPAKDQARLKALSVWQFVVVQHLARRIAAPDRPDDASIPSVDDADVAGFVDAYVSAMPRPLKRDLLRCFAYVEHVAPLRSGFAARFTRLAPFEQDAVLLAMESSDQDLLRGAFDALRALVFMGYYRDARTWPILGYEGPQVASAP